MERFVLVVVLVLLIALAAAGLRRGWRHRAERQTDIPAPTPPPVLQPEPLTEPLPGIYVSTTRSGDWQDRVVVHGFGRRARATLHLGEQGVLIERIGETDLFIPAADLTAVGTAPGIAGKVMGVPDGILVLTWTLGAVALDSGFRADDPDAQQTFLAAAQRLIAQRTDGAPA